MIRLILNVVLIVILALSVWGGFKRGLIRTVAGIIAIIVSLIAANLFSSAYARQLVPALNPFVGGYISSDTTTSRVLEKLGYKDSDYSLEDILSEDSSLKYDYSYEVMRELGFYIDASEDLAMDAVNYAAKNELNMTNAVTAVACNTIAYVGCIAITFIMVLILLVALLDMINIDFRLPKIDIIDEVGGSALGLIKGFLYCVLICWVLGFAGLIIGKNTADRCALVRFFLAFRFITRSLI